MNNEIDDIAAQAILDEMDSHLIINEDFDLAEIFTKHINNQFIRELKEKLYMNKLVESIAKVAHETNRAFCQTIGDNSQPTWEDAPEWQKESARKGVEFHLQNHKLGITPSPSASHDSWLEEKRLSGWKYGPVKNPETKEHPCYVAYAELPATDKLKDYLFGAIVKAFYVGL